MNKKAEYLLKKLLSEIFLIANSTHFDIKDFAYQYLTSNQFNKVINNYEDYYYSPYKEISTFLTINNNIKRLDQTLSNDIAIYIGYIYAFIINRSKEPIKKILKILPINKIIDNYDLYHTLSEENVLFISKYEYNLKMNNIRKYRSKNNPSIDFKNEIKNLYIAKYLYLKLFYYPEISYLNYKYDDYPYLINEDAFLCTKTIDDITNINNIDITYINNDAINKILFIFINNELILNNNINKMLLTKFKEKNLFNNIILFDKKKILFINYKYPPTTFYLDINNIDLKKIDIDMNNRHISTQS